MSWSALKGEFRKEKFRLQHSEPLDFYRFQLESRAIQAKFWKFVAWKCLLLLFFLVVLVFSVEFHLELYGPIQYYFIYLTNWNVLLCTTYTLLGAVLAILLYTSESYVDRVQGCTELPGEVECLWFLSNVTINVSITISCIYWLMIYDSKRDYLDFVNITTHGVNIVVLLLDLIVTAQPFRILHLVQPLGVGVAYVLFTLIFYLLGGTDAKGTSYIYTPLNWEHPSVVLMVLLGVLILIMVVNLVIFGIHQLKLRLCGVANFSSNSTSVATITRSEDNPNFVEVTVDKS